MSLSLRFVIVDPKGEVLRLSNARFERLLARPPQDSVPEFAGKRLRAAEIVVQLEQRRPVAVCRICYYHLNFDGKGFVDYEQYLKEGMVPMLVSPDAWPTADGQDRVVSAAHRFAARRLEHVVRWRPSARQKAAIHEAALGNAKYPSI